MRILLFISFFILISLPGMSQFKYGQRLKDSTILAINSNEGSLYVGIDNPLQLNYVKNNNADDFLLSTNNGKLFFDSLNYISIPKRSGKARIVISTIDNSDTTLIGYKYFIVKNIPDPMLQIDTLLFSELDTIMKSYLLTADNLEIFVSSDIIGSENWFKIIKYEIGYFYGGLYTSSLINGNKLTNKAKQIIYKLGPGKELVFDIAVEGEGKLIKELPIYRFIMY